MRAKNTLRPTARGRRNRRVSTTDAAEIRGLPFNPIPWFEPLV
jgi:hypothetical protein